MKYAKWIALFLAVAVFVAVCCLIDYEALIGEVGARLVTPFSEMAYERPAVEQMETDLANCRIEAQSGTDKDALMEQVWKVYNFYNTFYTQYNLASIYYFKDMTDTSWEAEYSYCARNAASVDAMLEEMFYALADSPLKEQLEQDEAFGEGFFDSYSGESVWDETFLALMEQEAVLEEEYYDVTLQYQDLESYSDPAFDACAADLAEVFVELVKVRQEMAEYVGYENYADFAYDFYHYRDYTPRQAESYLKQIQKELVPLYRQVESRGGAENAEEFCRPAEAYAYVESAAQAMGGVVGNAFKVLREAELYDITYSDKKYDGSFEVYLPDYAAPYVFIDPATTQQDKLTFAHEFGHFCNDFASWGSVVGVDVAEVFSQGLEYLSLCYGDEAGTLTEMKMVDCLRIYVEQAAYATFEQEVYRLEDPTVESVFALYEEISISFGFDSWDWEPKGFVLIGHFYTDPLYIISYVVSNDAAFQLYQMEQEEPGTGLALFEQELATEQTYFLSFVEEAGLESPFAPGRVEKVRQLLESVLA